MWVTNLRYMWERSSEGHEFDNFFCGGAYPCEFFGCPMLADDFFASLSGYGFVDGKPEPHVRDDINAWDVFFSLLMLWFACAK